MCLTEFNKKITNRLCDLLILAIKVYQYLFSPWISHGCRFFPSCSNYALGSLEKFGFVGGIKLLIKRICKCHPFHPGGYDPIPHDQLSNHPNSNDNLHITYTK